LSDETNAYFCRRTAADGKIERIEYPFERGNAANKVNDRLNMLPQPAKNFRVPYAHEHALVREEGKQEQPARLDRPDTHFGSCSIKILNPVLSLPFLSCDGSAPTLGVAGFVRANGDYS
jgi:hypothetical protein